MSKFEEFARSGIDACPKCGNVLAFHSRFKKFGDHEVLVCAHCKTVTHNGDVQPLEVAE